MSYKIYTKEEAREELKKLVDNFHKDSGGKKDPVLKGLKESGIENKYITLFFSFLNWNIHNEGLPSGREEFRVQTSIKINKKTRRPDYELWIPDKDSNEKKMRRVLFMEAKDPSYNLAKNVEYIRQAYQYAHSTINLSDHSYKRTRLSILTDFEEFRLFDCFDSYPLKKDDHRLYTKYIIKPFDLLYTDYITHFNDLWDAFERNNVYNGSLKEYFVTDEDLRKTRNTPDLLFLDDIKNWRLNLAKSMYKLNNSLSDDFLTSVSQEILNRLIFIKMLYDRELDDDLLTKFILDRLSKEGEEVNIFEQCKNLFDGLNKKYNGDIFKTKPEFNFVKVENKILQNILESLKPEKSVYNLSAMPVEIIGNAYEQFLGEVITHKGGKLTSEQKSAVQKAGGVYYTPRYIVEYIVENTVGEKLKECKNPLDVEKIKILDPACGSGSFLIGAYEYLLKWHLEYFKNEVDKMISDGKNEKDIKNKFKNEIKYYSINEEGEKERFILHLSARLKNKILKNNIFGVDIDNNAVQISMFNLSMKILEDITAEEINEDRDFYNKPIFEEFKSNIKHGNSLISTNINDDELFKGLDLKDVNPFNWKVEFSDVFNAGGFDCVIGNPPYIRIQGLQEYQPETIPYLKSKYLSASSGNIDIYVIFLELALKLINNNGLSGYILPHKFFQGDMGFNIRKIISERYSINKIINFGHNQIFGNATTYTCLFFMSGKANETFEYCKIDITDNIDDSLKNTIQVKLNSDLSKKEKWIFHADIKGLVLDKLEKMPLKLGEITRKIFVGLQTSADKIYVLKRIDFNNKEVDKIKVFSQSLNKEIEIESALLKPFLMGKDVKRYQESTYNSYVIFPYLIKNGKSELMSKKYIKENFPLGWEYLLANKKDLENRENGRMKNEFFYAYIYPKNLTEFDAVKIMTPDITNGCNFTIDERGVLYHTTTIYSLSFNNNAQCYPKFYIGVLNSKLMKFFIYSTGTVLSGGFTRFKPQYMSPFPIPNINLDKPNEKQIHDNLVSMVDSMLDIQKKYHSAMMEHEKELYKREIDRLDNKIDALVYELYGLTEDEIKVVEGAG